MKPLLHAICLSLMTAAIALAAASCGRPDYRKCEGSVWATTYHITYKSDRMLDDSILAVMAEVEHSLSPFDDESLVTRINRNQSAETDTLLRRIFYASQRVNSLSHGAFDPTVAPLVNLWGFGYKDSGGEPAQAAIDSALTLVGIMQCRLEGSRMVKCHANTEFNFSAITKGYGCDLVGEMLRRNGCTDYMVEIGGEIALSGVNPRGEKWRIMIDEPVDNDTAVVHKRMAVVSVSDCGVATSGNYRNFRLTDGGKGKVWHTISPVTGRPAASSTLSATVIAPDAMTADALATACMAMQPDEAMAMIDALPDTEAMLVVDGGGGSLVKRVSARFPADVSGR